MQAILPRLWEHQLIGPRDVPPCRDDFEVVSVFNPGVIATPQGIRLLLRVAERPRPQSPGHNSIDHIGLPRYHKGQLQIDWVPNTNLQWLDPRVVRLKDTGHVRLTFVSSLRLATSNDGRQIDTLEETRLLPQNDWEEYGVEDPRITKLNDRYYITYVAVSRHGAATALASTTDFLDFHRHGIIFPPENKDVLLFPQPIGGRYRALHRPNPATQFSPPEMWLASSDNLTHWGDHVPLLFPPNAWESGRVGGGVPPIATESGWLEIYHGNRKPEKPGEVGQYTSAALLLDLENPTIVRKRTLGPILVPQADFEQNGFVPGVVFPTALIDTGETFLLYYGAADTSTGVVELAWKDLHHFLTDIP